MKKDNEIDLTFYKYLLLAVIWIIPIAYVEFTVSTEHIPSSNISIKKELVTPSEEKAVSGQLKLSIEKNKLYNLAIDTDCEDKDSWGYYFYVNDNGKVISKKATYDFKNFKPLKQKGNDKIKRDILVPIYYMYDNNKKPESIELEQYIETRLLQSLGTSGTNIVYGSVSGIILVLSTVLIFSIVDEDDKDIVSLLMKKIIK